MSVLSMFARRLALLRTESDMTQSELSQRINRARNTVNGYEKERKMPTIDTVCMLANIFNVSTDYLLGMSRARRNEQYVFFADTVNFEHYFNKMPLRLRPHLDKCFKAFYQLLMSDAYLASPARIHLYNDLFTAITASRSEISQFIDSAGASVSDPANLSQLMAMQANLKNSVNAILDQLLQSDMETTFNLHSKEKSEQSAI